MKKEFIFLFLKGYFPFLYLLHAKRKETIWHYYWTTFVVSIRASEYSFDTRATHFRRTIFFGGLSRLEHTADILYSTAGNPPLLFLHKIYFLSCQRPKHNLQKSSALTATECIMRPHVYHRSSPSALQKPRTFILFIFLSIEKPRTFWTHLYFHYWTLLLKRKIKASSLSGFSLWINLLFV